MDDRQWEQIGASTGVVVFALAVATIFIAPVPPTSGAEAQEILQYYADNRTDVLTQIFLQAVSIVFLLWFGGSVRSFLRRAEAGTGRLSAVAFGGAVALAVVLLALTALTGTLTSWASSQADPLTAALLFEMRNMTSTLIGAPGAVLVAATSFLGLREQAVPAWLTWYGFLLAAGLVLAIGGVYDLSGPLAAGPYVLALFFGFALWLLAISIVIIQRLRQMTT